MFRHSDPSPASARAPSGELGRGRAVAASGRAGWQDRHVQVVLPGVWPGVKFAVIAMLPTRNASLSLITLTFLTAGKPLNTLPNPYCGSSVVFSPRRSASAPDGLAATVAPLARWSAEIPPA